MFEEVNLRLKLNKIPHLSLRRTLKGLWLKGHYTKKRVVVTTYELDLLDLWTARHLPAIVHSFIKGNMSRSVAADRKAITIFLWILVILSAAPL